MSVNGKPLITIVGALSKQGRSAAHTLLESGRYRVRALTRRVDAPEAQSLARLGAELMAVPLELGHQKDLVNAFRGSHGVFLMTQASLALMQRGSTIVNNLSIAAERVFPGSAAYNASKHGALGFTNTLREELRSKGIRVIALMPGATDTAIWEAMWPQAPRRKMMAPETVARTVVDAMLLPANATVEKIVLMPSAGAF